MMRIYRDAEVRRRWAQHIAAGLIGVCPVVELEMLRAAGGRAARDRAAKVLGSTFGWVPMPEDVFRLAHELQDQLASSSAHQGPSAVDLLVAVTAQAHGLKVLHYDRDYETIAKAAGVEMEWVARPGSVS
nr:PIN domain-containing protein [Planomonospora venezuelensis]